MASQRMVFVRRAGTRFEVSAWVLGVISEGERLDEPLIAQLTDVYEGETAEYSVAGE